MNQPTLTSEDVKQVAESCRRIEAAFIEAALAMLPRAQQFGAALRKVDQAIEQNYRAAGAPYGDSMEGRWRWMNEAGAAFRAEQEARDAEQRQRDLADFRRLGAQARANIEARKAGVSIEAKSEEVAA